MRAKGPLRDIDQAGEFHRRLTHREAFASRSFGTELEGWSLILYKKGGKEDRCNIPYASSVGQTVPGLEVRRNAKTLGAAASPAIRQHALLCSWRTPKLR